MKNVQNFECTCRLCSDCDCTSSFKSSISHLIIEPKRIKIHTRNSLNKSNQLTNGRLKKNDTILDNKLKMRSKELCSEFKTIINNFGIDDKKVDDCKISCVESSSKLKTLFVSIVRNFFLLIIFVSICLLNKMKKLIFFLIVKFFKIFFLMLVKRIFNRYVCILSLVVFVIFFFTNANFNYFLDKVFYFDYDPIHQIIQTKGEIFLNF